MSQGSSNPTTDLKKVNGTTVDTSTGNASAGTQRVVLATNQPVIPISDNGGSLTVDGTVAVSSLPALPTGSNTIGTVDISATSLSALETINAAQSGTWNIGTVTTLTSITNPVAVTDNGGSLTVDAPVATPVFVRLSDGAAAISTLPVSLASVPTHAVTQSGTWNINNISGTISLPTGAATAAKQPALGTAGTASTDVITVQGIASMTALKVDGSAVTQPVSGTFWQATQPVSIAAAVAVTDNNGSLTVDAPVGTPVYVRLSDGASAITALPVTDNGTTLSIDDGGSSITVDGTITSLTQFNGVAIALNAGTVSTGTLRVVNATGATGTQTNPSLSTTSATVLAASTSRLGATIYNGSTSTLYLRLSATAASTTVYTTKLYPDDYYEVPANYNGAITGILDTGTTTLVQVTQIT